MATSGSAAEPGRYIVVLKDGTNASSAADDHAASFGARVTHVYEHALKGYAATLSSQAAANISNDPRVDWVQPDAEVHAFAQTLPTGIDRADAELSTTAKIDGADDRVNVDVAVLDTGIDLTHPDLNVYRSTNCSGGSPFKKKCGTGGDDDNGHGSHVAGTIGALDNSTGPVGVAPGARLWAVKVLNSQGSGYQSWIVAGIDYVAANAAEIEVANMSLGGGGSDDGNCGNSNNDAEHKAICNAVAKGVTFAVAAGNSDEDSAKSVPAAYDEVITVSALADFDGLTGGLGAATCRPDVDDTFADFSNWGSDVDIIAPGVCIYSTYKDGGYATISGTSMASPHVAGAAALYKVNNPSASPAQVRDALIANGGTDWSNLDDADPIKESLLNVKNF
ncbi:MAG: S8 family peptidase [Actinomycetota bacterium]|nr:S8 family peptidase [Actinomycetota bacterium]